MLKQKINSFMNLFVRNRITKPCKLGDHILLLATAPCVSNYFEKESVKQQFAGYDIACINYMLFYSKEEVFNIKPKYFILLDPCLYKNDTPPDIPGTPTAKDIAAILNAVDWECYIITTVFAEFQVENPNIKYIRLSCFSTQYRKWLLPILKRNWVNLGYYNVIQGALFFAIVFGYKNIALLGCPYKHLNAYMIREGLHIVEHRHYYDDNSYEYTILNQELAKRKESFLANLSKRAYISNKCLWDIRKLADYMNCQVVNYSEKSEIDAFPVDYLK